MNNWVVSKVELNTEKTHVTNVRVHFDDGGKHYGEANDWTREEIIAALKKPESSIRFRQKPIYILSVHGTEYIKTMDNAKEADTL